MSCCPKTGPTRKNPTWNDLYIPLDTYVTLLEAVRWAPAPQIRDLAERLSRVAERIENESTPSGD